MSVTPLRPPRPARFAPIPLVSGEHITRTTGQVRIASVTVTVTDTDGNTYETVLEERQGAWWVPKDQHNIG